MKCDKLTHEFSEQTQKIKMLQQASSGRGHHLFLPLLNQAFILMSPIPLYHFMIAWNCVAMTP